MEKATTLRPAKDTRFELVMPGDLKARADRSAAVRDLHLAQWIREAMREKLEREAA